MSKSGLRKETVKGSNFNKMTLSEYAEFKHKFDSRESVLGRINDCVTVLVQLIQSKMIEDPSSREIEITNALHIYSIKKEYTDLLVETFAKVMLENNLEYKKIDVYRSTKEEPTTERDTLVIKWDYLKNEK